MNSLKKIGGYNLLILLVYTILVSVLSTGNQWQMSFMIFMSVLIALHVGINFIVSLIFFVQRNKIMGRNYLLSALLILVIGFSTCFGIASI
jgi:hypothetical protein